jgi:hypothetical protein
MMARFCTGFSRTNSGLEDRAVIVEMGEMITASDHRQAFKACSSQLLKAYSGSLLAFSQWGNSGVTDGSAFSI